MTKDLFYKKKGDDFILYKKGILQAHNTLSPFLKLQPLKRIKTKDKA